VNKVGKQQRKKKKTPESKRGKPPEQGKKKGGRDTRGKEPRPFRWAEKRRKKKRKGGRSRSLEIEERTSPEQRGLALKKGRKRAPGSRKISSPKKKKREIMEERRPSQDRSQQGGKKRQIGGRLGGGKVNDFRNGKGAERLEKDAVGKAWARGGIARGKTALSRKKTFAQGGTSSKKDSANESLVVVAFKEP